MRSKPPGTAVKQVRLPVTEADAAKLGRDAAAGKHATVTAYLRHLAGLPPMHRGRPAKAAR